MYLRTERRRGDKRTMGHLIDLEKAWCKTCSSKAVEDAGHYMCRSPNDLYAQVRKAWYKKVIKRVKDMSMKLWEVFVSTVVLKHGMLVDGDGQGADGLLTAWNVILLC